MLFVCFEVIYFCGYNISWFSYKCHSWFYCFKNWFHISIYYEFFFPVPVNFLRPKDGSQRFFKEKVSYEHMYNSRLDPHYPVRGKVRIKFKVFHVWILIYTQMYISNDRSSCCNEGRKWNVMYFSCIKPVSIEKQFIQLKVTYIWYNKDGRFTL